MKRINQYIDIEIDKLTNSIENRITSDSFPTDVLILEKSDLKHITKTKGWLFNWRFEFELPDRDVYKLTITGNPSVIQGLVSLTERDDHVYMHLIESAPFNRGLEKVYLGFRETWLHLHVKFRFTEDSMGMYLLLQKHN